jgi:hypothetical protein
MTPADHDAHQAIFGSIGYGFFGRDLQTGRYDRYLPSEDRFKKEVDGLAQEIKGILDKLGPADLQLAKPAIYVAEVSPDLSRTAAKSSTRLRFFR